MISKITSARVFEGEDFPLRVMRNQRHDECEVHQHEFHELVIFFGGRGLHLTSDGAYPLEVGDVFLVRGDMAHGYADTEHMSLVNILFDPAVLHLPMADLRRLPGYHVLFRVEPRLRRRQRFRGRLHLSRDQLAQASKLVTQMENEVEGRRPGYRFMASTHLMHLIGYLSRCYSEAQQVERQPLFRIGELLSYIERHFDEPLTVAQMASMAAMSESSLARTFRHVTGKAPLDYVLRTRVAKAAELLRQDDQRITEVALACGFSDSNYFSRQFRRVTGQSPREYRQSGRL